MRPEIVVDSREELVRIAVGRFERLVHDAVTQHGRFSCAVPWDPLESTCRHASLSIL